jgi:hypothetical protein
VVYFLNYLLLKKLVNLMKIYKFVLIFIAAFSLSTGPVFAQTSAAPAVAETDSVIALEAGSATGTSTATGAATGVGAGTAAAAAVGTIATSTLVIGAAIASLAVVAVSNSAGPTGTTP